MKVTALCFRVCILAGAGIIFWVLIALLSPATDGMVNWSPFSHVLQWSKSQATTGDSKASALKSSDKKSNVAAPSSVEPDALIVEREKTAKKHKKELVQPAKLWEKGQFSLDIQQRQFANMPVWVEAKLKSELTDCYPYSFFLSDFGNNQIEIAKDNELVQKTYPNESYWCEASNSQKTRLPLHMVYKFSPGHYSVRWTVYKKGNNAVKLSTSNWAHFEIVEPTNSEDSVWLLTLLENQPGSPKALRADFIPSLIAAAPRREVLRRCIELSYHQDGDVSMMAENLGDVLLHNISEYPNDCLLSARYSKGEILFEYLRAMRIYGANFGSQGWIGQFTDLDVKRELFALARRNLYSANLENANNSISWLKEFVSQEEFKSLKPEIDREILSVAPKLIKSAKRADGLISYFDEEKSEVVRELFWRYANSRREDAADALCPIANMGDPRDFARLRRYLEAPQGKEDDLVDRTLGYWFHKGYDKAAVPVLKKTIMLGNKCSVDSWLCMERLHRIELFRFILDALEHERRHKRYVLSLLKYMHADEISKQHTSPLAFARRELHLMKLNKRPCEWNPDYNKSPPLDLFVPK